MARVNVKVDIKEIKNLVPRVRKEFAVIAPKVIENTIRNDIKSGVSPVKGQGRFLKYSKSYLSQIKGDVAFRTSKSGHVFPITKKGISGKGAKKRKQAFSEKLEDLNSVFTNNGKKVAPVNLMLTGAMLKSLFVRPSLALTRAFTMLIAFGDDKADFHNNQGAAGKAVRRLLPTRPGEKFNTKIDGTLRSLLNKSVSNIVKRFR